MATIEPNKLRDLMVKTGTPQPAADAATHHVGPQPNLKWALAALSNERAMHGGCCQRSRTDLLLTYLLHVSLCS